MELQPGMETGEVVVSKLEEPLDPRRGDAGSYKVYRKVMELSSLVN